MGNDVQISEFLGCPPSAVRHYTSSVGWRELAKDMRQELDSDLEHAFTRLGFKAIAQIEDRLKYGDFYLTKTGERARRPLDARTLAVTAQMLFDQREQAKERVEGKKVAASDALADALNLIAEKLRTTVPRMQRISPEIIDVDPATGLESGGESQTADSRLHPA
jgi:hypothetical protein